MQNQLGRNCQWWPQFFMDVPADPNLVSNSKPIWWNLALPFDCISKNYYTLGCQVQMDYSFISKKTSILWVHTHYEMRVLMWMRWISEVCRPGRSHTLLKCQFEAPCCSKSPLLTMHEQTLPTMIFMDTINYLQISYWLTSLGYDFF